jgi:hypothetical protein
MRQRQKPFRSKALMRYVHQHMKPAPCAACLTKPWSQLHHWGDDNGKGIKPSDHIIVRLCVDCAKKYELKWKALFRDNRYVLFNLFATDTFYILRSYIEHLESRCSSHDENMEETREDPW